MLNVSLSVIYIKYMYLSFQYEIVQMPSTQAQGKVPVAAVRATAAGSAPPLQLLPAALPPLQLLQPTCLMGNQVPKSPEWANSLEVNVSRD